MSKCVSCGEELRDGAQFCAKCGFLNDGSLPIPEKSSRKKPKQPEVPDIDIDGITDEQFIEQLTG